MAGRIASTKQAADYMGITARVFLQMRSEAGFPKPVITRASKRGHHLFWDIKAIELWLDRKNGIKQESGSWKAKFLEEFNGEANGALPH